MPAEAVLIDDQPISASFFGEGKWLSSFITPNALDIKELHNSITKDIAETQDKVLACWKWVADKVRYVKFVRGRLEIEGKASEQEDLWNTPSVTARVKVGNCANKAFLLTSLIRNDLPSNRVHCVLGNLYSDNPGGHAWVQIKGLDGQDLIMESTRSDVNPLVPADTAARYDAVHLFNDKEVFAIPGKTQMIPFTAAYSDWLKDYLDWKYIKGES